MRRPLRRLAVVRSPFIRSSSFSITFCIVGEPVAEDKPAGAFGAPDYEDLPWYLKPLSGRFYGNAASGLYDYMKGQFEQGDNKDLLSGVPQAKAILGAAISPMETAKSALSGGWDFLGQPVADSLARSYAAQEGPPIYDDGGVRVSGATMQPLDGFNVASIAPIGSFGAAAAGLTAERAAPQVAKALANDSRAALPGTVVNVVEQSKPIRAYHGTNSAFEKFDRIDGGNARGDAVYFSTDPGSASAYAMGDTNRITPKGNAGPNVLPVDINAKLFDENALVSAEERRRAAEIHNRLTAERAGRPLYPDEIMDPDEFATTWFDRAYEPKGYNVLQSLGYDPNEQNALLRELGYQGRRGGAHGTMGTSGGQDIALWDRGTVKSATTGETLFANNRNAALPGVVVNGVDSLPMDQASRLARAREMGFDTSTPYYHGTTGDFSAFDPLRKGETFGDRGDPSSWLADYSPPMYFASNPDFASQVAAYKAQGGGSPSVMPVYLRNAQRGGRKDEVIVRNPADIRSVNATFDPAQSDSPFLLAANDSRAALPAIVAQGVESAQPQGIRAYHGSPHDFDRFDISKIGSGEGAQAYGHGLYFAESEDVARSYRDSLAPDGLGVVARGRLRQNGGDVDKTIEYLRARNNPGDDSPFQVNGRRALAELEAARERGVSPGRMYEVDINAKPEQFLDWDRPLGEQIPTIRDKLSPFGLTDEAKSFNILQGIAERLRVDSKIRPGWDINAQVSDELRQAGVPGIRFLDQGSRAAGDGSRNYVVFDDGLVNINRKYANPATAGIPAEVLNLYDRLPERAFAPEKDK